MSGNLIEDERAVIEALIGKFTTASIIQQLWKGFGAIYRVEKKDGASVILKHFNFAHETEPLDDPMPNSTRFSSFQREIRFYEELANASAGQVPRFIASKEIRNGHGKIMAMEDLDPLGFPARFKNRCNFSFEQLLPMVRWLAKFHASFWRNEKAAEVMWPVATYWNIEKRKDEFQKCKDDSELIKKGEILDKMIHGAKYKTLIHGDGKVENFCFSTDGKKVAGIDFQWSGQGVGTSDLFYLLTSCYENFSRYGEVVDEYFKFLREEMQEVSEISEIEQEWRYLWPIIVADFERFLITWNPNHWKRNEYSAEQSKIALDLIRS